MERNNPESLVVNRIDIVDVVAIERQARAMRAEAMAEMFRAAWNRIAGGQRRPQAGQTA